MKTVKKHIAYKQVIAPALCMPVAVLLLSSTALAQAIDLPPGSVDAGRIIKNIEPAQVPAFAPPVVEKERQPDQSAPAGADKLQFTLKTVTIVGANSFSEAELLPIYANDIGKEIPLARIFEMAAEITRKYHEAGYAISRAVIPPQEIEGGNVTIRVIEGYINRIDIQGDYRKSSLSEQIINRIRSYKPLNMNLLERDMLLLSDMSGIVVRAVLKKPEETALADEQADVSGATNVELIFDESSVHGGAIIDNYGTRFAGPFQLSANASANHVLLPYHLSTLNVLYAPPDKDTLRVVQFTHRLPLNAYGTTLTFVGNQSHSEPGYTLEALEIVSNAYQVGVKVTHPVIRSRSKNLSITADFTVKDTKTDTIGTLLSHDKLRVLGIGMDWDGSDMFNGANVVQAKFSQGLSIFNATKDGDPDVSRQNGRSDFSSLYVFAGRLQRLEDRWQLFTALSGQYSWSPLLSVEQFGYGGRQFGRAYDPSEMTGDRGIAGSVELRYSVEPWGGFNSEVYAFIDGGTVWNFSNAPGDTGSSAGLGIRFNYDEAISGELTVAKPLSRRVDAPGFGDGTDPRGFFTLSAKF